MNDQVVELCRPGLQILLYSPFAAAELEEGGRYARAFPDGCDLVDTTNRCRIAGLGVRWPALDYWLHFSTTLDHRVISRASDHVRLGLEIANGQLCVRGGDDLFSWKRRCPGDQLVSLEDGFYAVTACMLPFEESGPARIFMHLAAVAAPPDLGYEQVPELFCEPPLW